jgi:hypothetical protein
VNKTFSTPIHLQSNSMVEQHIKRLRSICEMPSHHTRRTWTLCYQSSSLLTGHPPMTVRVLTPANLVFQRELHLSCDLLFGAPPNREWPTINHVADLADHIHNYGHQQLKLASDEMKTHYDWLAKCEDNHEGNNVWLYRPTCTKGKSPKL